MKLIKKILYFIIGILMVSCVGILICALNPTLTGELAEQVQRLQGEPGGQGGEEAPPGVRPGEGNGGYQAPENMPQDVPESVGGLVGNRPVTGQEEEISQEEADNLGSILAPGETGAGNSFSEEYYPYYAMLDETLKQVYSQVYANTLHLNTSFTPVVAITAGQAKNVVEAVYNDHPELFWLDAEFSCKYLKTGICVEISLEYNEAADNLEAAQSSFLASAEKILSGARELSDPYEKEKYVHDALLQIADYDMSAGMNQSAYSALVRGKSVCAGYSKAFQYLLQQLGIPCYFCTGYAGGDHAWNIVKLGSTFRNVDVTWDDTEPATYDYYNKSDEAFAATHARTDLSVWLPACVESPAEGDGTTEGTGSIVDDHINPNPQKPMEWQEGEEPEEEEPEISEEEKRRENLEKAGIREEDVLDTLEEYYEDCEKQLKQAGTGDILFTNVIPESLWPSVERAYSTGSHEKGYVEEALKELDVDHFVIQLQVQRLGGGYYNLFHSILTY